MQICKITVESFRIFEEKSIIFSPGINLIVGNNAKGKTTLIEAIYLLMAGKSFRTEKMEHLIKEKEDFFRLEVHFEKWGVPQHLKMAFKNSEKRILHNYSPLASLSGLLGTLHGVLLAPQDIDLVKGPPAVRRHYLDFQIAQIDPLYIHHMMRYSKALKIRNLQIRTRKLQAIEAFEETMSYSAAYLMDKRKKTVNELNELLGSFYKKISGKEQEATLRYHPSFEVSDSGSILEKLQKSRSKDIELGFTSVGIHRDDLFLSIGSKLARNFASEGESRSLVAALKLSEWERIRVQIDQSPVLLIDDIGISLDLLRLNNLIDLFLDIKQVLITSPIDLHLNTKYNYNIIKI